MFRELNEKSKKELLTVVIAAILVALCWTAHKIYRRNKKIAREACMDECKRREVRRMINSNIPDKEIFDRVPSLDGFCKKECN